MPDKTPCQTCILLPRCIIKVKKYSEIAACNFGKQYDHLFVIPKNFVSCGVTELLNECSYIYEYVYKDGLINQSRHKYFYSINTLFETHIDWC